MFNIKVYEKDWTTFINTIQIEKLENVSNYSCQINGGFSNISFGIVYEITNNDISIGNIIKIQYKADIIYIWSVLNLKKIYSSDKQTIQVDLIWIWSILTLNLDNQIYSDTASNIIKDLIWYFNAEYWSDILSYTSLTIPDTVWTINIDLSSYKNYFEAFTLIAETVWLYFFIDLDWVVSFKEKSNFTSHTLTIWLDINELIIEEDSKELVNSLILKYAWWTQTYNDWTSQTLYWKREKYIDKSSELWNLTTANAFGSSYLDQNKNIIKKVSINVNNKYNFLSIKWWDLINIRNIWYVLDNLQVSKITYWFETATIELEKSYSFAKEVFNS